MTGEPPGLTLSYRHRGGRTPLIGETVDRFLRRVARRFPEREAIVSLPQGVRLTYSALQEQGEGLACALLALGIQRGDRVGIWSTDNVEWILLQLAAARVGAVLVNINPACRTPELRHALRLARVQTLFVIPAFRSSRYVDMLVRLCPEAAQREPGQFTSGTLPDLRRLVVYDPDSARDTRRPASAFHTWPEIIELGGTVSRRQVDERAATLDPDDPINIQFTSGTTGFAKAVVLTHHNIINNAFFVGEAMGFTERDRLCVPVPFYHCFGMVVSTLACLTHGAALVIPAPHFEAGATLVAIEAERCTAVHGVPTMFMAELERPDFRDFDLSSLRTGIMGGAPCPAPLLRRVVEEMGCEELLIGYGQTEASPITHLTRPDDVREGRVDTVGTNLPHQEVKIVDPDHGGLLPVGAAGEICFRGYHVMRGYFGQPEETARAIDEAGWLHSGDLGVMDRHGSVRITGRLKDMIIRGGENIYPAEVEAFYHDHPQVAEVAVFGVPDPKLGEAVGAWIKLRPGADAGPDDLRRAAEGHLAHFKIPRYVWLVDEFPMTVTGKIQKFRIREIVAEWMRAGAAARVTGSRREAASASGAGRR